MTRSPLRLSDYCYLDYAATAPLRPEAAAALKPYLEEDSPWDLQANPNALYTPGRKAFEALENHRRQIARDLGARRPDEIIFTSGATEADNLALRGLAYGALKKRRSEGRAPENPRVIVSAIEHDAVLKPAQALAAEGFDVVYLRPNRDGFIEERHLAQALNDQTLLVSIQMANSEFGSIQSVIQLAEASHEFGAVFHSDAVQALGKTPLNLKELTVDAASFSSHKIGGPKGIGCLYLKAQTNFEPQILGGGQESRRRSGTQNVALAAGFSSACFAATQTVEDEAFRLAKLRDKLYAKLCAMDGIEATVEVEPSSLDYLPNIVHVLVSGYESETLVLRYDSLGFAVSGGSACASASLEPSHGLLALGISGDKARGALRVSLGFSSTEKDVDDFLEATHKVLNWS